MNEQVAKLLGCIAIALALIGIGAGSAWAWQANKYTGQLATQASTFKGDLLAISNAAEEQARQAVANQQRAEQAVADLDTKHTQEKTDALAENEALRTQLTGAQDDNNQLHSDVAAGYRRLRIAARCPASNPGSSNVSAPTSTASLGDAASVELSQASGQSVFDIRAGIIADQAALKALQDYSTNVCRAGSTKQTSTGAAQ